MPWLALAGQGDGDREPTEQRSERWRRYGCMRTSQTGLAGRASSRD